ncbi:MAG: type II toxin-antitoxin system HicA family toxin [Actinobacteria bacterium]|nr:type II toxin-antitoxin system HicA family toxin [Actinomycetota bacterium]
MSNFPTMKARDLLRILQRKPLNCSIMRTRGSHRTLRTPTGKIFRYSYHDSKELSGNQVRDVLMDDLGLTEREALGVLQ